MVLTRRAVALRFTMVMVRAVCKMRRRKKVSTVLDGCRLVEGAVVDWK
jgi:hypothetical protein